MPLATVWIPSYNYGRFLPEAIESVLVQTHRDLELIVWDDGSTDDSYEIARGYASHDERMRVFHHPNRRNHGIAATLVAAFAAARGVYVCGLAADDTLVPDSLERRVNALEANPDATFAYGLIEMVDEHGKPTGEIVGTPPKLIDGVYATSDPLEALLVHNYIPGHSVLLRTEAFARSGGVDGRLLYSDWELWMRLLALGPAAFVGTPPVANHRSHSASMSLTATPDVDLERRLEVFRAINGKTGAGGVGRLREPRIAAFAALQQVWHEFAAGNASEARGALERALSLDPGLEANPQYLLWWIGPHQYAGTSEWFADALARTAASAEAVVAEGNEREHFGSWAVTELRALTGLRVTERLAWGIVANEVEAASAFQPSVFRALVRRMLQQPRLVREPWFAKSIVCSVGAWRLAVSAKDLLKHG
jgi:GT2 family glycosyltransferase